MYKTTITLKDNLSEDKINEIHKICAKEFDNRVGKLENVSSDKNVLIFEGEKEEAFDIIGIGIMGIDDYHDIKNNIKKWTYIDTDENEEENVLDAFSKPIYV